MSRSSEFRSRIDDPVLTGMYDYWLARCDDGRLPARRDIDPVELGALLPYVLLAEYIEDGRRVRYRLVGTNMVRRWGLDFTGSCVDEIMTGSYRDFLHELFFEVAERRCAVLSAGRFRWDVGRALSTRRLFMPLAKDGQRVDMVFIGQTFMDEIAPAQSIKISESRPDHVETLRFIDTDSIAGLRQEL